LTSSLQRYRAHLYLPSFPTRRSSDLAVFIPVTVALLAAYGFAWVDFKGRDFLFIAVFALQIVPIQITLVPLLTAYVDLGVNGTLDRKSTRLNSSHVKISYAVFCLKKK